MEGTSMLKRVIAFLLVLILLATCIGLSQAASVRTMKKGSRGSDVKTLQTALKDKGFYNGKIDGIYGKKTVSAVKAFQRKNGLKADGVAGPKTLGKLYEKSSAETESPAETNPPSPQVARTLRKQSPFSEKATFHLPCEDQWAAKPEFSNIVFRNHFY